MKIYKKQENYEIPNDLVNFIDQEDDFDYVEEPEVVNEPFYEPEVEGPYFDDEDQHIEEPAEVGVEEYDDYDYIEIEEPVDFYYEGEKITLESGDRIKVLKEKEKKVEPVIIEIKEDVTVRQDGHSILLEAGDKIEVLKEDSRRLEDAD